MATGSDIASLRRLINEPEDVAPYTDLELTARIDAAGGLDVVAYEIWGEKAAAYADLVDVSEGGSSRKMGDLHEQALNMVSFFGSRVPDAGRSTRGARVYKLGR